jgi:TonB family protein
MIQTLILLGVLSFFSAHPPRLSNNKREEPEYSEEARRAHISGQVVLSVTVGTDGLVTDVKVVKSLGYGLDESAVKAIRTWVFKPGTNDDGTAIESSIPIECNFKVLERSSR